MGADTIAQIKGVKVSEATTKGKVPQTNVGTNDRTPKKEVVDTTKFPFNLGHKRYVEIQIYNTIKGDPNEDLLNAANGGIDALGSAFEGFISDNDFINNAKASLSGAAPSTSTLTSLKNSATTAWDQYKSQANGLGNPKLPNEFKDIIFLPLPNDLQEKLSHTYTTQPGITDDAVNAIPAARLAIDAATGASNIMSKATGRQAISYNKNLLAKFDSSNFRSISLTWTLIPNNQREAIAIQTIITKLKAYSSPQAVANKLLLRAPFFAKLVFQNEVINQALQFQEVVMTSVDVNWTVSGHMETFHDDNPKTVSLTIDFQDREPKTSEAWGKGITDTIPS